MRKLLALLLLLVVPVAYGATAYENYASTFSPTLFYYGTETSGNIINHGSSGTNYNLAAGTAPTYSQTGVNVARGTSLGFASASTQVMLVNRNDTGTGPTDWGASKTFECWTKLAATGTTMFSFSSGIANSGAATDRLWSIGYGGGSGAMDFRSYNQEAGTTYVGTAGSTTPLSSGVWYLMTGTWAVGTHTVTVYLNGVSDGTSSTIAGGTLGAQAYIALGRRQGSNDNYMNGNLQDCLVLGSADTSGNILARYNFGTNISAVNVWPFQTKAPRIPDYRNDGWLEKVKSRGYMDGHFTPQAKEPLWLTVGWLPFSTLPPGNVR